MLKLLLLLFVLLALQSCKIPDIPDSNKLSSIDVEENISAFEFLNLSEIADDVKYVPLETDSNCLIVHAHQIIVLNDLFIIAEKFSCKAFDRNGRYICSYGSTGNGPGQFLIIDKVSVNQKNKLVYLSCGDNLLEFTIDGHYIRNIKIPKIYDFWDFSKYAIYVDSNNYWCVMEHSDQPEKIFSFSTSLEVLNYYSNYFNNPVLKKNRLVYACASRSTMSLSDRIIFKDGLCDTVYYLNPNLSRQPAYLFHFGKYSKLNEYLASLDNSDMDEELKGALNHLSVSDFFELHNHLLFTCAFGNHIPESEFVERDSRSLERGAFKVIGYSNSINAIFDTKASELVFLRKTREYRIDDGGFSGFVNDIDGGPPFWPSAMDKNNLMYLVDAYDLKMYVSSETFNKASAKFPEKKASLKILADTLKLDSNPVLMIVSLKKNYFE